MPNLQQHKSWDYTGENANLQNFFAVLSGNKTAVKGGSGKVIDSKSNDMIFLYYTDHGASGFVTMPSDEYLYGKDVMDNLSKKYKAGGYKEMVLYIEACESGSMIEGIIPKPEDLNIYVTTASNAHENSYATYCVEDDLCLGDMYSISWMEDSEAHNRNEETLTAQYERVRDRTNSSHVMQYGKGSMGAEKLDIYQGFDPASADLQPDNKLKLKYRRIDAVIDQWEVELYFQWHRYKKTENGFGNKTESLEELRKTMRNQYQMDGRMNMIGVFLFGPENGPSILSSTRQPGLPVVDDWDCLKSMVGVFEERCGPLGQHGLKHVRGLANICNNGVSKNVMEEACNFACDGHI